MEISVRTDAIVKIVKLLHFDVEVLDDNVIVTFTYNPLEGSVDLTQQWVLYRHRKFWLNQNGIELSEPKVEVTKIQCKATRIKFSSSKVRELLAVHERSIKAYVRDYESRIQWERQNCTATGRLSYIDYAKAVHGMRDLYEAVRLLFEDKL